MPEVELREIAQPDLPALMDLYENHARPFVDLGPLPPFRTFEERFQKDRFLGADDGRMLVVADSSTVGFVGRVAQRCGSAEQSKCWTIGIVLATSARGGGIGARA